MSTTATTQHSLSFGGHSYAYLLACGNNTGLVARLRGLNVDRFFVIVESAAGGALRAAAPRSGR